MTNLNKIEREKQIKAMKLAEMVLTDKDDSIQCIRDMQEYAGLNEKSAKIVAASIRDRVIPALARQYRFSDSVTAQVLEKGNPMTFDFAKDDKEDLDDPRLDEEEIPDHGFGVQHKHVPNDFGGEDPQDGIQEEDFGADHGDEMAAMPMKQDSEDTSDDADGIGEADDEPFKPTPDEGDGSEMVTIQIETTRNMLDKVKDALDEALGSDDDTEDDGSDDFSDEKPDFPVTDTETTDEDNTEEPNFDRGASNAARRTVMSNKQLAERQAARAALLEGVRTASEEYTKPKDIGLGHDTSGNGKPFQFKDEAQYKGEQKYPKLTMENSGGNSLKGQNPTYSKIPIPTNNPENLQLPSSYDAVKLNGSPDGTLNYNPDLDWGVPIPSAGDEDLRKNHEFAVPTEMDVLLDHNTNAAGSFRESSCEGCTNPTRVAVHQAECSSCKKVVAICELCEGEGFCPSCEDLKHRTASYDDVDEGVTDNGETKRNKKQFEGTEMLEKDRNTHHKFEEGDPNAGSEKEAATWKARVKTAYAVSTRLAMEGLLPAEKIEMNAEMYLENNLSAKAMVQQAKLWIDSASTPEKRVASSHSSVRTASTGMSVNPSFGSTPLANSAVPDLDQALKSVFASPDYASYFQDRDASNGRNRR